MFGDLAVNFNIPAKTKIWLRSVKIQEYEREGKPKERHLSSVKSTTIARV